MEMPKYLQEIRPDIIITLANPWWMHYMGQPQMQRRLRFAGAKWILYYPLDGELGDGRIPENWIATIATADVAVAYSQYGVALSERCGLRPRYIPHGVDTRTFCPPSDKARAKTRLGYQGKFVILSDARNQPRKMLPRLLSIFARFAVDKPDVFLHLHCDPKDPRATKVGHELRRAIAESGVADQVSFTKGFTIHQGVPIQRLAQIYQAADIHLLTSGGEGFGLPTLQAAAAGVVPFAPDYSANTELVKGHGEAVRVSGFVEEEPYGIRRCLIDVDDCIARLEKYYTNRSLLFGRGQEARRFALPYDWSKVLPMWDDLLREKELCQAGATRGVKATIPDAQISGPATVTMPLKAALRGVPPSTAS